MSKIRMEMAIRLSVSVLLLLVAARVVLAEDYREARLEMVKNQIAGRGITDELTLAAMRKVPRHQFVPENMAADAYKDRPLPIGHGQTISQPYIVAFMTERLQLKPGFRVLEIGTGSGYQAAILDEIVKKVYTVEIIEELAEQARQRLVSMYPDITVIHGDGYFGWQEGAPYDAIIVTAAAEFIPPALIEQLREGGRMVIPVGSPYGAQWLTMVEKASSDVLTTERLLPVRFVPFTRTK